ncbi:hypothetical protein [Plantactinospora endophytica]|uniref:Bypass of forespore C C-terminal domain-containing protein n=1 Tax=Plantactinospora endophytica TaxID=673535 RepID=A0ABQ4DXI1_9ACTN|nr:hypothetical protein [Plantactinospora endophytica]GIG86776.1 hypothetical protein Pen02_17120 [Plantactinospora endophytica]
MITRNSFAGWYRNRFVWVAVILLAASATAVVLVNSAGSEARPADLRGQILTRMRTTLESADPEQHQHAGHNAQQTTDGEKPAVICGVHVYGFEPAEVSTLAEVKTVYGFHLCGVAEKQRPWDWAVKLAGPVIMDMSKEPPGIQVVEATAEVRFVDRLREMFPDKYEELALKEALAESEMTDLRRRYDAAAGL